MDVQVGAMLAVDEVTITKNASSQAAIKDGSVGLTQLAVTPAIRIATGNLSGASTQIASIPTGYVALLLVFEGLPSGVANILITVDNDTGAGYDYRMITNNNNISSENETTTGNTSFYLGVTSGVQSGGRMSINQYPTAGDKVVEWQSFGEQNGVGHFQTIGSGKVTQATPAEITSIEIKLSAGTWSNGKYILMGLK